MSSMVQVLVWDHYKHGGTRLLVMLALADSADDEGLVYPSVKMLAKMTRTSIDNARKVLGELIADGALELTGSAIIRSSEPVKELRLVLVKLNG